MSDTVTLRGQQGSKFFEGWLDHKGRQTRSAYRRLWVVLKGNVLHIFSEKETRSEETAVGSLIIDGSCKFCKQRGNSEADGYKFELYTNNGTKTNRFKATKKVEMEFWRGYIVGLSKGILPSDLDLMPDQISKIKSDVDHYHRHLSSNRASMSPSADSGIARSIFSSASSNSSERRSVISGEGGGPVMRHKFTNDPAMNDRIPSWFFVNCDRRLAEEILVNAKHYGNTLMRESSRKNEGSYVISKLAWVKGERPHVDHFEVERVDKGYKLKIENPHDPKSNLTEVMNYFLFTSGVENTIKLQTNKLAELGISEGDDPYQMKKIERQPVQSQELPEPLPDYEEPVPAHPKTYSAGSWKKESSKMSFLPPDAPRFPMNTLSHASSRKSLPAILHVPGNHRPAPQDFPPPPPTDEFDPPDPHVSSLYYNLKDGPPIESAPPVPPPGQHFPRQDTSSIPDTPPTPCQPSLPNMHAPSQNSPAPPTGQQHRLRSKSVPNINEQIQNFKFSTPSNKVDLKKQVVRDQGPISSVKPRESPSTQPAIMQPGPSKTTGTQPLSTQASGPRKTQPGPTQMSHIQQNTTKPSPVLPGNKQQPVGILKKTNQSPAVVEKNKNVPAVAPNFGLRSTKKDPQETQKASPSEEDTSAIDESNPGSVGSIIKRFQSQQPMKTQSPSTGLPTTTTPKSPQRNSVTDDTEEYEIPTLDSSDEEEYVDGVSAPQKDKFEVFKRSLDAKLSTGPCLQAQRQQSATGGHVITNQGNQASETYEEIYTEI